MDIEKKMFIHLNFFYQVFSLIQFIKNNVLDISCAELNSLLQIELMIFMSFHKNQNSCSLAIGYADQKMTTSWH
jgi:hypothetical protein